MRWCKARGSNAMKSSELISEALKLIGRFEVINEPALSKLEKELPEDLYCTCAAINWCCGSTTRSTFGLLESSSVWDATILLRTVINATAKFCYLLCGQSEKDRADRLEEYVSSATVKEYGSMYPRICAMMKQGLFGSNAKFVSEKILEPLTAEKLGQFTPIEKKKSVDDAYAHLQYLDLSAKLESELPYWRQVRVAIDFDYSAANTFVHLNHIGTATIIKWLALSSEEKENSTEAQIAHVAFMLCVLQRVRSEAIFKLSQIDPNEMRKIMAEGSLFIKAVDNFGVVESARIVKGAMR